MTVLLRIAALTVLLLAAHCGSAQAQFVYLAPTGEEWDGNCSTISYCSHAATPCSFPSGGQLISIFGTQTCGLAIVGSFGGLSAWIDAQTQTYFGFYIVGPTRNLNLNILSKASWQIAFTPSVNAELIGGSINAIFNTTGKGTLSIDSLPFTNNPITVADYSATTGSGQGVALTLSNMVVKTEEISPFIFVTDRTALVDSPSFPSAPTTPMAPTPISETPERLYGRATLTLTNVNVSSPIGSGSSDIPLVSATSTCLYAISITNSFNISASLLARSLACALASGSAKITLTNSNFNSLTSSPLQFPIAPSASTMKLDWAITSSTLTALTAVEVPPSLVGNVGSMNQTLSIQNSRLNFLSLADLYSTSISSSSFYNVRWAPTIFNISGAYFEMNLPAGSSSTSLTFASVTGPVQGLVVNDSSADSAFNIQRAVEFISPTSTWTSVLRANRIAMSTGSSLKLRELTVTEAIDGSGSEEGRPQLGRQVTAASPLLGPRLTFSPSTLSNTSLDLTAVPIMTLLVTSGGSALTNAPFLASSDSSIVGVPQSIYINWTDSAPPTSGVEYVIAVVDEMIEGWSMNSTAHSSSDYSFSVYMLPAVGKREMGGIWSQRSAPLSSYPRMVFKLIDEAVVPTSAPIPLVSPIEPVSSPVEAPVATPQVLSCPPPIPAGFICVDGHLVAPGGVTSNTTIVLPGQAGVITVGGNLTIGGSVTFSGVGSSINVTGCVQISGGIVIDLRGIKSLPKGLVPLITQSANCSGTNLSQIPVTVHNKEDSCEKVTLRKQATTEAKDNKQTLSVVFYLDNSGCNTKWIILGAVLGGLVVIAVIVIIATSVILKNKRQKRERSRVATA